MPNYKGHLFGAAVVYTLALFCVCGFQVSLMRAFEWFVFALIGALFPDIDTKSKGQKLFYYCIGIVFLILVMQKRFQALAFVSFIALFPLIIRHRGITHSLWFIGALCISVLIFVQLQFPQYASIIFFDVLFFFIGALSHLILDRGFRRTFRF